VFFSKRASTNYQLPPKIDRWSYTPKNPEHGEHESFYDDKPIFHTERTRDHTEEHGLES
jgi:hypothetical protein